MREDFNKMSLEQWCANKRPALDSTLTFINCANCTNDSLFRGDLRKKEKNANNNLYKILVIEELLIEELNGYGMNQVVEDEAPMQMFNLLLQGQQYKLLEGLYTKDDVYAYWIQCVQAKEEQKTQDHANKV
jgi:hypothetical protein